MQGTDTMSVCLFLPQKQNRRAAQIYVFYISINEMGKLVKLW